MQRFSLLSLLIGVTLLLLGAGMRVYAAATNALTEQRLISARPATAVSVDTTQSSLFEPASVPPDMIRLPAYGLWNALEPVTEQVNWVNGQFTWQVKDAGWHVASGLPGWTSNVVVAGHSPSSNRDVWSRSVFRQLAYLNPGDEVDLTAGKNLYRYQVRQVFAIPAAEADSANAVAWLAPGLGERLTLITCWPPNTAAYRVLVIAYPSEVNHE